MTREEFVEKYGDVRVSFQSYYKYTFTFTGLTEDGCKVVVDVGGNSDDIYRMEVAPGCMETIAGLDPYSGSVYKDGKEIESFYDN